MALTFTPSVIILGDFAASYVEAYNVQIAPWVIGAFADLFLQGEPFRLSYPSRLHTNTPPLPLPGILTAQTANYFNFRGLDNTQRRFTWLVIFLTILCCLKTSQNISIVWDTVLANFANPDVSGLLIITAWSHYTTSLSVSIYVRQYPVEAGLTRPQ
jgi:hypothetical protein